MLGRVIRQNVWRAVGTEAAGRLLLVVADLVEDRDDLADHQRQRHEAGRHDHAGRVEDDLAARRPPASARTSRCARCRRAAAPARPRPATPTAARRSAPTAPACPGTRSAPAGARSSTPKTRLISTAQNGDDRRSAAARSGPRGRASASISVSRPSSNVCTGRPARPARRPGRRRSRRPAPAAPT